MDETFKWFTTADLSKYEDKYISIVDKEVVCANEDPEVAYKEAKKRYPDKEIVLWKVPRSETFVSSISIDEFIEFLRDTEPDWYKEPDKGLILRPLEMHEVPSYA